MNGAKAKKDNDSYNVLYPESDMMQHPQATTPILETLGGSPTKRYIGDGPGMYRVHAGTPFGIASVCPRPKSPGVPDETILLFIAVE